MNTQDITAADSAGFATNPAFRSLLADAGNATGKALDALIEQLADMELLLLPDAHGKPLALAAYRRLDRHAVEIQYLAVAPTLRRGGVATALVERVRQLSAAMVVARAGADAIGFFRNAGFQCSETASDPRWPRSRRYLCVLPCLPLVRHPETDENTTVQWVNGSPGPVAVAVVEPRESWSDDYAALAGSIRAALGPKALAVEHLGSTSVPGLPAKPVIDVVLTVADPAAESRYVPELERAGFALRLREPHWYAHRMLVPAEGSGLPAVNLHVFAPGCPETSRMRSFRDWLRRHPADRAAYSRIKNISAQEVNERGGGAGLVMDYNAAKEPFIRNLYTKIYAAWPEAEFGQTGVSVRDPHPANPQAADMEEHPRP